MNQSINESPEGLFGDLLDLEEKFYREGYELGKVDGTRAGHREGRLFGLEQGFEKYLDMGNLHGRSVVWASRLPHSQELQPKNQSDSQKLSQDDGSNRRPEPLDTILRRYGKDDSAADDFHSSFSYRIQLPALHNSNRLEKHIQTLYALVEPDSLSSANTEDAVSSFDDRLRRARGKFRVVEKLVGEENLFKMYDEVLSTDGNGKIGQTTSDEINIEDMNTPHRRH